ncbi:phosphoglucosamine mutase [Litorimonas cladophorae]|uniref:Phosphoglucosamine mutase n=1 Tax=Litorimonas cladophorae TaxID=1220491 RepID=A0A918NHB5_9PROT|nr:phosphoglucosamine mutase [Litorimonas cladophorae]GGX70481.1 phosphoglucosamine mutase [Litorimonas cladophorae]
MSKFFGTDGVRGLANTGKMSPASILNLGQAAGRYFRANGKTRTSVLIGKDTRLSGYMVEAALVAGLTSVGLDVTLTGPIPTPGVALMTQKLGADLGVMITASHNKFQDNGIKFFGPDGCKLSDAAEAQIEAYLLEADTALVPSADLGRMSRRDDLQAEYVNICKSSFPTDLDLTGLKIVIDCANGAAYKTAPATFAELGADVIIPIGVSPNGVNINKDCGSTETDLLSETVLAEGADIGVALDGDADRLIMCDEKGRIIDGDQLLGLIGSNWNKNGLLSKPGIVATVMSNLGLERFIESQNMSFIRTDVGDRHVAARMRQDGYNIGGEQSGHLLMTDYAPTGDGTIAALQVLAAIIRIGKPASEALSVFEPVPQLLKNVRYAGANPMQSPALLSAIDAAKAEFGTSGRVLVRASGTEPLIRVMTEGDDATQVERIADQLVEVVRQQSKS